MIKIWWKKIYNKEKWKMYKIGIIIVSKWITGLKRGKESRTERNMNSKNGLGNMFILTYKKNN